MPLTDVQKKWLDDKVVSRKKELEEFGAARKKRVEASGEKEAVKNVLTAHLDATGRTGTDPDAKRDKRQAHLKDVFDRVENAVNEV